jgi:LPS export ABC transporter protein LptC
MTIRKIRYFLGVIILASLGMVAFLAWRTITPTTEKSAAIPPPNTAGDIKLDRVRYTETHEGIKEWELEAESAVYFKEENTVQLEKIKAKFFGKNLETYVLQGGKGKFNTQTKEIEIFDGVKVDSSDGYQFLTRSLRYQSGKKELTTPDPVEMSGPQVHIQGIGLILEIDSQRLKILRQVQTTLSQLALNDSSRSAL